MLSEQEIINLFLMQTNWQDRYRQLVILSKQLPAFSDDKKTLENQVKGCENQVWLTCDVNFEGGLVFNGDSDGRIVKGLLAVMLVFVNGKTKKIITEMDLLRQLNQLKLIDELTPSRQLGIAAIAERIKLLSQLN